jgi:hypothetical protein
VGSRGNLLPPLLPPLGRSPCDPAAAARERRRRGRRGEERGQRGRDQQCGTCDATPVHGASMAAARTPRLGANSLQGYG